jgi:flagellar hook-basal body complex protein FliE
MPTSAVASYTDAAAAYLRASRGGSAGAASDAVDDAGGFSDLVTSAVRQAVEAAEHSEKVSTAALTNGADLTQVVTAIAEAEATLQTLMAVRDRVVEAYKDIMRMPI